jgi:hypothetical protein
MAIVRDEDSWSAVVPAYSYAAEPLGLFSSHFPPHPDNSGFVG